MDLLRTVRSKPIFESNLPTPYRCSSSNRVPKPIAILHLVGGEETYFCLLEQENPFLARAREGLTPTSATPTIAPCWIDPNGRPTARDLVSGGPPDPAP
jgi:hypothetical protein